MQSIESSVTNNGSRLGEQASELPYGARHHVAARPPRGAARSCVHTLDSSMLHTQAARPLRGAARSCVHILDASMLHTHLGENNLSDHSHPLWSRVVIDSRSIVGRALSSRVRRSLSVKSSLINRTRLRQSSPTASDSCPRALICEMLYNTVVKSNRSYLRRQFTHGCRHTRHPT